MCACSFTATFLPLLPICMVLPSWAKEKSLRITPPAWLIGIPGHCWTQSHRPSAPVSLTCVPTSHSLWQYPSLGLSLTWSIVHLPLINNRSPSFLLLCCYFFRNDSLFPFRLSGTLPFPAGAANDTSDYMLYGVIYSSTDSGSPPSLQGGAPLAPRRGNISPPGTRLASPSSNRKLLTDHVIRLLYESPGALPKKWMNGRDSHANHLPLKSQMNKQACCNGTSLPKFTWNYNLAKRSHT